ncbi:hypothetical protein [Chamaesiphon polymorphus]|uniref:hypothetical protein n=1 Tax=Chamaesiphon polymorphus TaxID=2107691 RepID=UPI0015E7D6F9|nr:hypothetical protein [Chamaesiphon polymorphus]
MSLIHIFVVVFQGQNSIDLKPHPHKLAPPASTTCESNDYIGSLTGFDAIYRE